MQWLPALQKKKKKAAPQNSSLPALILHNLSSKDRHTFCVGLVLQEEGKNKEVANQVVPNRWCHQHIFSKSGYIYMPLDI